MITIMIYIFVCYAIVSFSITVIIVNKMDNLTSNKVKKIIYIAGGPVLWILVLCNNAVLDAAKYLDNLNDKFEKEELKKEKNNG